VFFVVNIDDPVGCRYGSETEIVVSTLLDQAEVSQDQTIGEYYNVHSCLQYSINKTQRKEATL
jgi:hypothetical protein